MTPPPSLAELETRLQQSTGARNHIDAMNALAWHLCHTDAARAQQLAEDARQLATDMHYERGVLDALNTLARLKFDQGHTADALKLAQATYDDCQAADYAPGTMRAAVILGGIHRYIGQHERALAMFLQALHIARAIEDTWGEAIALNQIGIHYIQHQAFDRARTYFEQSLALHRLINDRQGEITLLNNLCAIHGMTGDYDGVRQYANAGIEIAKAIGFTQGQMSMLANLGKLHYELADYDAAFAYYQQRLDLVYDFDMGQELPEALGDIAFTYHKRGDPEHAFTQAQAAYEAAVQSQDHRVQIKMAGLLSTLYKETGDYTQALTWHETLYDLREMIFDAQMAETTSRLEVQHRTEQIQQEAERYKAEKEAAENQRQQDRAYFERLNQLRDDLLHSTSHDLLNPIAAIRLACDMMRRYPNADRTRHLEGILSHTKQMEMLLRDVLDVAQLESGRALTDERVYLAEFVSMLGTAIDLQAQQKHITLMMPALDADLTAHFDPNLMSKVMMNLLGNAIKYTPEGGEVGVHIESTAQHLVLQVRDTGIGIQPDALPHIFERFYRVPETQHLAGTGLGLYIVKSIVDQHNGHISIHSTPAVGTTVTVTVPQ